MDKNPILIVDDDEDEVDMIEAAAKSINLDRPVYFFKSGPALMEYLKSSPEPPFLIVCDLHIPAKDGFQIRKDVLEDADTKYKSVPFIFWSTAASESQIQYAYDLPTQGFFFKPSEFDNLCETLKTIVDYWQKSQHPKKVN